jgi:hypothetical protein
MNKKTRSFSQTAVRESSVGPAYERPTTRVKPEVVAPARLDPRASAENLPKELGGAKGPEPTRFGDWEHKGRCTYFLCSTVGNTKVKGAGVVNDSLRDDGR